MHNIPAAYVLTLVLPRVTEYRESKVFSTSDCNQDECDPYTLHSNAEPLSSNKECSWAYAVQLTALWRRLL